MFGYPRTANGRPYNVLFLFVRLSEDGQRPPLQCSILFVRLSEDGQRPPLQCSIPFVRLSEDGQWPSLQCSIPFVRLSEDGQWPSLQIQIRHDIAGSSTINAVPLSGMLSTRMFPPICITECLTMDSPRPVPFILSERLLSPR